MEIGVPLMCGVLIGLCCACAAGAIAPLGDGAAAAPPGSFTVLFCGIGKLRVAALWGTWAPVRRAVEELVQLRIGEKKPFEFSGEDERLGALVCASLGCGLVGGIIAWSVWGLLAAALPVAALCAARSKREKSRSRVLEVAMPEAFGSLAISLGSGYSLAQAMRFVGARSAEPIRTEFMRVSFAVDCGLSAPEALDAMLERLRAPGLELVVLALKVSKRTGAPLGELLTEAAELCRERLELKRMLDVKTSQARMSARLVAGMPVAMIGLLTLLSSDFRKGLGTTVGALSIVLALALNAVAWTIIRKIMDVEV